MTLADLRRMQAIASYDLFNPVLGDELRVICRRTAAAVRMPLAAVQAVLDTATACIATSGGPGDFLSELGGAPNEMAICPTVVVTGLPFVAGDLREVPQFADNPGVTGGLLLAYAGVPLVTKTGAIIGSHCVMSPQAREFTDRDLDDLAAGAGEVMAAFERYPLRH
jgi:GAF domain-containing protein